MLGVVWAVAEQDGTTVAPNPPPRHVEWNEYPVGGLVLVNPYLSDTVGVHPTIVVPDGSILQVPHWTEGAPPDEARRKS